MPRPGHREIFQPRLSRFKLQIRGIFDGISPSSPEIITFRDGEMEVIKILQERWNS